MKRKKILSLILTASILSSTLFTLGASAIELPIVEKVNANMSSAKDITNVLKEWKTFNYKGEGMVISIIDSGIDYRHKDMKLTDPSKAKIKNKNPKGNGKYYTDKIPYGYNYADKNDNIIDTGSMHGMHVAGIVAANGKTDEVSKFEAIQGIAPEAQLLAMKVFSNDPDYPSCNDEDVVNAINDSVRLGADVINMSLGSDAGFVKITEPIQNAVKQAELKGVVVVISAGNSSYSTSPKKVPGIVDTAIVGSPSTAKEALSVASFENTKLNQKALTYTSNNKSKDIAYLTSEIDPINKLKSDYDIVDCGLGTKKDFENIKVKGKIALVQRGKNTFIEKKLNAQNAGAVGVIVFNKDNEKGYISMATDPNITIPAIFISNENGKELKNTISKGVKIKFNTKKIRIDNPKKNTMSDFSSWGPAPSLDFKPQITAPGGNILSTANDDKYKYMSGTSMAAPHTSGIMALVLQHLKTLQLNNLTPMQKVELAKNLVINTSVPQIDKDSKNSSLPYSPRKQGSGLIDALNSIKNNIVILNEDNQPTVALKQINTNTKNFTLTFKNYGNKEKVYFPKDMYGVLTEEKNKIHETTLNGATISFDKNKLIIPENGETKLEVTLNIPNSCPKGIFVEGFLNFIPKSKDDVTLGIPYMGFYGDWDESPIVDKPIWEKGSYLKTTGIYKISKKNKEILLGMIGKDEKTSTPIVNKDLIAVSPNEDDIISITPKVALLRNAKVLIVNVLDNKGNLVRTLSINKNLSKNKWIQSPEDPLQDDNFKEISPFKWDLNYYNSSKGIYETVPDGQYYFEIKSKVDFKDSKFQNIKLPIKVDSTAPELIYTSDINSKTRNYTLKFKAKESLSGIKDFKIMVNGQYIKDKSDNYNLNLKPNAQGEYNIDLNLLEGSNKILISSRDNAENISNLSMDVHVNSLTITSPTFNNSLPSGNFTLNYKGDEKLNKETSYYNILVDGNIVAKNHKGLSYKFNNLTSWKHLITVEAYDNKNNKLASNSVDVVVENKNLYINFTGLKREGSYYKYPAIIIKGDLSTKVKSFKIQGEEVKINSNLSFNKLINLKNGQNKVQVLAIDNNNKEHKYALNLYCDLLSPDLILKENINDIIVVDNSTKSYKIKCKIKDNNHGFKLFVNGNEINSNNDMYNKSAEYETDVNLNKGINHIEIKAVDIAGNSTIKHLKIKR
ncbi:S8 family serine peptidase [Clostridium botulinum C]|uniref:Serine protease n=2 Tax=Clostridium botulinum TaxID=1491 RepID=A0A9Q4XYQ6_CLOBO|nr:S8 family serine peptidase [Clostridium botulinum]MCD3195996.1 S8 family serine peptidase [Clostridium botulinum C]MCD3201372.1 S8 family serine peptidase [Clostridium botulinum C]MCD3206820.1 S8 family serine peptidase [Clostridium botulinum C]MCD3209065.1 S8 family serine peptidase [Clostridium botulinum C]MCD3225520.1 S8 family serine peptidase [Clostridium botulinum C]